MNNKRLPVTILTGFLGSGKTTLLRHLLLNSKQRLAVMINEFGSVGIDGDLIKTCGFCKDEDYEGRIVELNNGCLCCTVQDDFLPSMNNLLSFSNELDGIIIETSGLSLPRPLLKALDWPDIRSRVFINAVIALVDGEALEKGSPVGDLESLITQRNQDKSIDHETSLDELFKDQLITSDIVLISRADIISSRSYEQIKSNLNSISSPKTLIFPLSHGDIESSIVLGFHRDDNDDQNSPSENHHNHLKVFSEIIQVDTSIKQKQLEDILFEFVSTYQIIRLKGRYWIAGKSLPLQIQMVGGRLNSWYEAAPETAWRPEKGGVDFVSISFLEGVAEALIERLCKK